MPDQPPPEGATTDQSEDTETVNALTALVRAADRDFERVGGSSRHWVRDCFLPTLNRAGWKVAQPSPPAPAGGSPLRALIAKWRARAEPNFADPEATDETLAYWRGAKRCADELEQVLAAQSQF